MSTVQDLESAAKDWAAALFGGFEQFRLSGMPTSCVWLLASFGPPPAKLAFADWGVDVVGRAVTGGLIAVTDSHVIVLVLDNCPPEGATDSELSAWIRPRNTVAALELRADRAISSSVHRDPRCATIRFIDGTALNLPFSNQADVPDMVRVLTPR